MTLKVKYVYPLDRGIVYADSSSTVRSVLDSIDGIKYNQGGCILLDGSRLTENDLDKTFDELCPYQTGACLLAHIEKTGSSVYYDVIA